PAERGPAVPGPPAALAARGRGGDRGGGRRRAAHPPVPAAGGGRREPICRRPAADIAAAGGPAAALRRGHPVLGDLVPGAACPAAGRGRARPAHAPVPAGADHLAGPHRDGTGLGAALMIIGWGAVAVLWLPHTAPQPMIIRGSAQARAIPV